MKSDDPQFGPGQIERAVSSNCFRQPTRSSRLGTDRYYSTKVRLVKPPQNFRGSPEMQRILPPKSFQASL